MQLKLLTDIKRVSPEALLAGLRSEHRAESILAGEKLVHDAASYGLEMRDYLRLAIDPKLSAKKSDYEGLNGYEVTLYELGLPVKDDFDEGITLQLASDNFQTFPGTRALFPPVIDDLVQWKYRQDNFENIESIVAATRTISGNEMITTIVDDKASDYQGTSAIAELGNIPVRSIRTTEKGVKIFKIGGGYRLSYEFSRRARLDLLVPYANRVTRELERSKVGNATKLMINGDGVAAAAVVRNQSGYNGTLNGTATNGRLSYMHLLNWLVNRAKDGTPVDTVVGNWDMYLQWLSMFALPLAAAGDANTAAQNLAASGFRIGGVPIINGQVNFALSTEMPANQLLGITKGETLEQLVEAGSLISESERSIKNQSITYVKTENSGPRIVFPDTREIYNIAA